MVLPTTQEDFPSPPFFVSVSFVARFRVLYWGEGGVSLSSPFGFVICVYCDYPFTCFGYFLLCFLLFVGFLSSFSLPFLLVFCFVSFLLLPLLVLFLCLLLLFPLVVSWPFLRLLCSLFFLRLFFSSLFSSSPPSPLPHPPFRSRFGFFFSLLWPFFLGFLFFLPFLLFLLCPLPSSLFIFRLRFFPSTLFFPSCWLFFLLVCLRCLFGGFLFFLFAFLAFGFCFLSVCIFGLFWSSLCFSCWCFRSWGSPFVPVSLSSLLISRRLLLVPLLLLLSSSWLFLIFPLLCLFFLLFFYLVPSCRLCCCASLSGSFFLGFALLRSFLCPQPSSLRLCWGGGGGWLRLSDCAT